MNVEIERKFLVKNKNFILESYKKVHIKQGFLNTHKERTVRVRIQDNKSFLTVKGMSNTSGTTRFEWEKEIDLEDGKKLLCLAKKPLIEKIRHLVKIGKHTYEVDVFLGKNQGLIVAEIELNSEKEVFEKPQWIGKEITGQTAYYNSSLSKHPYSNW